MLSVLSQTQQDKCHMVLLISGIEESNLQKQETEWWLPGLGEREWELFNGFEKFRRLCAQQCECT